MGIYVKIQRNGDIMGIPVNYGKEKIGEVTELNLKNGLLTIKLEDNDSAGIVKNLMMHPELIGFNVKNIPASPKKTGEK